MVALAACGRLGFSDRSAPDAPPDIPADAPSCDPSSPGDFARWPIPNFSTGLPNSASYSVAATNDLVQDTITRLEWQRTTQPRMTHDLAVQYCTSLVLGGNCDWRLPERIELISITDYTKFDPTLDPIVFPGTIGDAYWSATPEDNAPQRFWYVSFRNGLIGTTMNGTYPVRCVRGGYDVPATHYTSDVNTVRDNGTGLIWERMVDPGNFNHAQAMARCSTLAVAGGGWRSPSINELESLVDATATSPAIHSLTFPSTPASLHWSQNIQVGDPSQGWTVNFDNGSVARSLTTALPVRCVR
jgi:hypothetical protein